MARSTTKARRGRPPLPQKEGKKVNFNARIDQALKNELDTAAKAARKTSSKLAADILKSGLKPSARALRSPQMESLVDIAEQIAAGCTVALPNGQRFDWYSDQLTFDAFCMGLMRVLEILRPQSAVLAETMKTITLDDDTKEILASAESLAKFVSWRLKHDLQYSEPVPLEMLEANKADPQQTRTSARISQYLHALSKMRSTWNLEGPKDPLLMDRPADATIDAESDLARQWKRNRSRGEQQ